MDTVLQAIVVGIVQGLTEFLPISSSGHLILVPWLMGWTDPLIDSLAFTVVLHMGTLVALLAYFWRSWLRLVPAGLLVLRDRSFRGDPDRKLAWLLLLTTIPAIVAGVLFNDVIETTIRQPGLVALMLVAGATLMWLAERWGSQRRDMATLGWGSALAVGAAQALALVPGISRSGASISAGLFVGLTRESAARFSFLMATPITALAGVYEIRKLLAGEAGVSVQLAPMLAGMLAAMIAGFLAIALLLRYLRSNRLTIFIVYRLVLAGIVVVALFSR